ncbi:protection of telomeres protein 1b-like isoform X1 [Gossypium australe]|uniref:Protection of telomeres protein 1b-like isoform X1 n=1 Tax=Gossypium australe TaxID=47621 RepID=A0A5B6UKQ3_9ROSI|nr:protection of telomeres protein 1b-like isoform X1 [Gossypium australe]
MPSKQGLVKLNIDGAISDNTNNASIEGVFTYSSANWLHCITMKTGKERIFKVEARAILKGLQIAWEAGYRHLELECNNAMVVELILVGEVAVNRMTEFLCIKDAVACINDKVDLIAVILNFSLPQTTRGTDYVCKLKIIDESHPEIPVHVFAQEIDHLPFVTAVGDIIHLSRVVMRIHEGDVYAIFNKRFSSFALYDGKDVENFQPYQVLLRYEARKHDAMIIAGLRKWLASSHVIDAELLVIEGDQQSGPEDEEHNPLPLHFKPLPSSGDVLHTFPTVGTILRLIFDVECMPYILQLLKVCQWFKLFCVECKVHEGLWYGVFTSYSKIRDIPNVDILILERQRSDAILELSVGCLIAVVVPIGIGWQDGLSSLSIGYFLFSCDEKDGFLLFFDCSKRTKLKVRKKFRCVIRFVAVIPWRVEDFRSPDGVYRVKFTLEDPTARIHAYSYAEDGEKFFNGLSTGGLKRKLNELLGVPKSDDDGQEEIEGGARNPPWDLEFVKAAAWAWYQRGSSGSPMAIPEFDVIRTRRAPGPGPSRYKLEAMRNNNKNSMGYPTTTSHNSLLDPWEVQSISKRLDHLIQLSGIQFYEELLRIDADFVVNDHHHPKKKSSRCSKLKRFLLRRRVCGTNHDVVETAYCRPIPKKPTFGKFH